MNQLKTRIQILTIIAGLLSGCSVNGSDLEQATGKGSIRALHAISDLGPVDFLIEETVLASIDYKNLSGTSEFDDLTYAFNFDILLPQQDDYTRMVSREVSVVAETEYSFILTGSLSNPEIILWEQFGRDWQPLLDEATENSTTVDILDVAIGHLAGNAGNLDIYLSQPGTVPVSGSQFATLNIGGLQQYLEIASGDYQLIVTNQDNPDNYLFASEPFSLTGAASVTFVVMDPDEAGTAGFVVRALALGTGTELLDINATTELRAIHAAENTETLDIIVGDQFALPLISALDFGMRSASMGVPAGNLDLNITPAGNGGSFLAEENFDILKGSRYSLYLTGLPGQLDGFLLTDAARRLSTHALLRVYQGSARLSQLDFYLVPGGSDIALLSPTLPSISYTGATGYIAVVPDSYDLIFALPGSKIVVAGPLRQDLTANGIYDAVTTDSAQTDQANLLFFSE